MGLVEGSAKGVPQPGDVLAGKYRVERVIGVGGMGVVLAAMHMQLEERVAIKLILQSASTPETVARFLREGKLAVKIRSEHVARVMDVGTLDTGEPYLVMEYLEGSDLAAVLQERGALPIPVAVLHILQACEALAEAHAMGIVHRDLKPGNLYLTTRADGSPCVKVLDFGISKASTTTVADAAMTKTSAVMGSPLYMSPEQMRSSRSVDARTDVWALGTILHELLSGGPPYSATTMPELIALILQDPPPPLRQTRPDAPLALEVAIQRCLEKDPASRYSNVAELAAAIVEFGPPEGRTSLERVMRVLKVAPGTGTVPNVPRPRDPSPMASTTNPGDRALQAAASGAGQGAGPVPPAGAASSGPVQVPPLTGSTWSGTNPKARPGITPGALGAIVGGGLLFVVIAVVAIVLVRRHPTAKPDTPAAAASSPATTPLANAVPDIPPPTDDPHAGGSATAPDPDTVPTVASANAAPKATTAPAAKADRPKPTGSGTAVAKPDRPAPKPTSSGAKPAMDDRHW
jgi:serine/threonine-protein kinase